VYATAHELTLTPGNIKAAFQKTGVVPFDPSVVTPEMMAPSLELSSKGTLPLLMSSPLRAVSDLLTKEWALDDSDEQPDNGDTSTG